MANNYVTEKEIDSFLECWSRSIKDEFKNLNFDAFTLNFISKIIKSFIKDFDLFRKDLTIDELKEEFMKAKEDNDELEEYKDLEDAVRFLFIRINMYESREANTKLTEDLKKNIEILEELYENTRSLVEIIHYTGNSIIFKNNFKEDLMSDFIKKFKIPGNIYLYRLTNTENFEKLIGRTIDDLKNSGEQKFAIKNIISTSLKQFDMEETNYETGNFDVFIKIDVPEGSAAFPTDVCSAIKGETEVLLPIGTEFKLKNITEDHKYIDGNQIDNFIELEIV